MTAAAAIVRGILDARGRRDKDGALLVGLTGIDGSGKSTVAAAVRDLLIEQDVSVDLIHADMYHRDRSIRYDERWPAWQQYYELSVDFERLERDVVVPLRAGGRLERELRGIDPDADDQPVEVNVSVGSDGVLIVEGVFLLRSDVRGWFDFLVYLDVSFDDALRRVRERDAARLGDDLDRRYAEKYFEAQRRYLALHPPSDFASLVVVHPTKPDRGAE